MKRHVDRSNLHVRLTARRSAAGRLCTRVPRPTAAALEPLQAQIQGLSAQVREWARTDPSVAALVDTLPSIGAQSAATLLAELGDPHRFARARAVAAYSGFVPRVSQSADKAHHGRMTKQGNPELRWITSQWAVRLLTSDPLVRSWAAPLRRRLHANKARMALARRLLVGVLVHLDSWRRLRSAPLPRPGLRGGVAIDALRVPTEVDAGQLTVASSPTARIAATSPGSPPEPFELDNAHGPNRNPEREENEPRS